MFDGSDHMTQIMQLSEGTLAAALLAVSVATTSGLQADQPQPNILFIMIDDMGWMDLHCQGNEHLTTPNVDHLAEQGVRFTDAYAAAPVCSPTRAAVMTGLSPARLHITNHLPHQDRFTPEDSELLPAAMEDHLALDYTTIAERLKEDAGYKTAFIGKWHLYTGRNHQYAPQHQGFDLNIGGCAFGGPRTFFDPYRIDFLEDRREGEYLPDRLADETIAFMQAAVKSNRPFYTALFNYTVHWPMEAPEELIEKYSNRPKQGYRDHRYAAMIEAMDNAIGRILKEIDRLGIAEDTFVVFTSDNGPFGGVGDPTPLRGDKGHLYEGGIRVPLIVRWPGKITSGRTCKEPVILTDFYPTLLEVAGLKPSTEYAGDGASLMPLLTSEIPPERDAIFWHYPNFAFHKDNRLGSAVRMDNLKLIEFFDDNSVELYDLLEDLGERRNLAASMPEKAAAMKERLHRWRSDSGAAMPVERVQTTAE